MPTMNEIHKDIVIIYHDQCRDGFGSAYAAWKKFGDDASYVPLKNQVELPAGLIDKELYILDYSFKKDVLEELRHTNKKVVVIDHHQSAAEAVTAFPENIFDQDHSGAVLSWQYFHPDTEVPSLLLYVEDHDIWKFILPDNREFNAALGEYEMSFVAWDELVESLKDQDFRDDFIATGRTIAGFEDKLVQHLLSFKEKVNFEGHDIYALNVSRIYRSILGHHLAQLNKAEGGIPLGIVYYRNLGAVHISLRSEDDIDVAAIAARYGGGGHKHAASIRVDSFADLPFSFLS